MTLAVVDSGPGPPADVADRLFEPFVSSKPEGSAWGWRWRGRSPRGTADGSAGGAPTGGRDFTSSYHAAAARIR
ncbi:MAG: hypothetical protein U0736_04585 [Gemmataceae bacterium]